MEITITVREKVGGDKNAACHEDVEKTVDITPKELAAAIIEDSIGYASPRHAMRHIKNYRNGKEEAYCERAAANFDNDMESLIKSAVHKWYRLDDGKKEELLETAEEWSQIEEEGDAASLGVSMLYPTRSVVGA